MKAISGGGLSIGTVGLMLHTMRAVPAEAGPPPIDRFEEAFGRKADIPEIRVTHGNYRGAPDGPAPGAQPRSQ